jgi:hypothetical protein
MGIGLSLLRNYDLISLRQAEQTKQQKKRRGLVRGNISNYDDGKR